MAELTDAISAATPVLDADDLRIVMATYRQLAKCQPVTADAIAQAIDLPVGRLALAALDPEYRLVVEGRTSYVWRALDTLFIPAYLGKTVRVESTDPASGAPVSLVVDGSGVRELTPSGVVVSNVIPDGLFGFDVIESFCHKVLFFASEDAGRRWTTEHQGTTLLSVQEAFELGQAVFGARN
jgi:hypothetical protein